MNIPLFDAHCDTAFRIFERSERLRENSGHIDLARSGRYLPYAQFFAFWANKRGFDHFMDMYNYFRPQLDGGSIALCVTGAELEAAGNAGVAAAILSVEGGELLDCSVERLRDAHRLGVRAVNITWNYDNELSGSRAGSGGGLTSKGFEFVREMAALHMLTDVSHISDRGFFDVCETVSGPFIASHSNSRSVCDHKRNLTDDMFKALRDSGGVAGINLYPYFLNGTKNAACEHALRHIFHLLELGGEKSICLGCDFDGIDDTPSDIEDLTGMVKLYDVLSEHGVGRSTLLDIFYNNLMRVVKETCDM